MNMKIFCVLWFLWISSGAAAVGGLSFTKPLMELPAPAKAGQVSVDFPFTNDSTEPAIIRRLLPSCHCLEATILGGKLRYEPGEKGILRARVKIANVTQTLEEKTVLWLEGDREAAPSAILTVRLVVPEVLKIEPRILSWSIGGAATPKVIRIHADDKQPVNLTKLELSQAKFQYTQRTISEGKDYEIEIRPVATAAASFATLRIETDSPLARYKSLTVILAVQTPQP